jgi:allantoinase
LAVDLVIKGGKVYTPDGFYEGNVVVDYGEIVSLTRGMVPEASRVLDASGCLVLPGMIDMHVHFRDPGFTEREDFESGTRSAAAGGVTTVADMPNTVPSVTSVEAVREKVGIAGGKALVDFALIAGAGELSSETLRELAGEGVVGYKTFMIARFKELAASDSQMLKNFNVIAGMGLPCMIHAENQDIVAGGIERAKAMGRVDPIAHSEFRPPIAEDEATLRTVMLSEGSGVHLHICHMSTQGSAEILSWAKRKGRKVTGETSANYLFLKAEDMKELGPYAKIDPPLRGPEHQKALWTAINTGVIDAFASDHAPYPREDKEKGWEDIFEAPSGGTGVETSLPLMLDSVRKGLISLERLVGIFSETPAKIMGLYPRKGALIPGADADIAIIDPGEEFEIKGENLHSKQKVTAFEGYKGEGIPITTIVRGEMVMEQGEVIGRPGYGEYQRPLP